MTQAFRPTDDELISAYLDGELSGAEQERAELLLRDNAEYLAAYDELRSLRETLQSLPSHELDASFAERVLRRAEKTMLLDRQQGAPQAKEERSLHHGWNWTSLGGSAADRSNPWRRVFYVVAVAAALLLLMLIPPLDRRLRMARFAPPEHLSESPDATHSKSRDRDAGTVDEEFAGRRMDKSGSASHDMIDYAEKSGDLRKSGVVAGGVRQESDVFFADEEPTAPNEVAGPTLGKGGVPQGVAGKQAIAGGGFGGAGARRGERREASGIQTGEAIESDSRFAWYSRNRRSQVMRKLREAPQAALPEEVPTWLAKTAEQTNSDFIVQLDLTSAPKAEKEFNAALIRNRIRYDADVEDSTDASGQDQPAPAKLAEAGTEPAKPDASDASERGVGEKDGEALGRDERESWAFGQISNFAVPGGPPSPVQVVYVEAPVSQVLATLHDLEATQTSQNVQVQLGLAAEEARGLSVRQTDAGESEGVAVPTRAREDVHQYYLNVAPQQLAEFFDAKDVVDTDVEADGLQAPSGGLQSSLADAPRTPRALLKRSSDDNLDAPADAVADLELDQQATPQPTTTRQQLGDVVQGDKPGGTVQEPVSAAESEQKVQSPADRFANSQKRLRRLGNERYGQIPGQRGRAYRMFIVNDQSVHYSGRDAGQIRRFRGTDAKSKVESPALSAAAESGVPLEQAKLTASNAVQEGEAVRQNRRVVAPTATAGQVVTDSLEPSDLPSADAPDTPAGEEPLLRVLFVLRSGPGQRSTVAEAAAQAAEVQPAAEQSEPDASADAPDK